MNPWQWVLLILLVWVVGGLLVIITIGAVGAISQKRLSIREQNALTRLRIQEAERKLNS